MNDTSFIDKTNQTFIALTATAIHYRLSAWTTDECRVTPEFGPGGGAHLMCNTRNIGHTVNRSCTDVCHHADADVSSSSF